MAYLRTCNTIKTWKMIISLKTKKNIEDILLQHEVFCYYSIEDEHSLFEYSIEISNQELEKLRCALLAKGIETSIEPMVYEEIDWIEQAKAFAPSFTNGFIEIDLQKYAPSCTEKVHLHPKHAFGDCSHPTTTLVLEMMAPFVKNKTVVDIGTGSGILSIAAALFGANRAYGIDIDPDAIDAAKQNVLENGLEERIVIQAHDVSIDKENPFVVVCNMIFSEVQIAFSSHKDLIKQADCLILSGFRSTELEKTRKWLFGLSWKIDEIKANADWICFYCTKA